MDLSTTLSEGRSDHETLAMDIVYIIDFFFFRKRQNLIRNQKINAADVVTFFTFF